MNPNELTQAQAMLARTGYHSTVADDRLIVSDPYHVSTPGGGLKVGGWTLTPVRDLDAVTRFISDRT